MTPRVSHALALSVTAALLAAAEPALSEVGPARWTVRAVGVWVAPSESFTPAPDVQEAIGVTVDDALGAGLFLEARLGRRLGLELGVLSAGLETEVTIESPAIGRNVASDEISFRPITLGLPIRLAPGRAARGGADLVVAPLVAYIRYGDIALDFDRLAFRSRFSFDDELTWGAALGVDLPLGSGRWSLSSSVRWLAAKADGGEGAEVTLDPLVLTAGAAYSF